MADLHVYVGTYTANGGEGIYHFSLNPATGELRKLKTIVGVVNPSFLALAPDGRFLYSVNEVDAYYGRPEGALSAFSIEPVSGDLSFLNQQPSKGAAPCHLSLDRNGRHLFVANYGGGSVAVFPIGKDGRLEASTCHVQHGGSGPNLARQQGPHAHCVVADAFNRHMLAVDLGADAIHSYPFDPERGALRPPVATVRTAPGSGPRHLAFHPNGKWAYAVHELQDRLALYRYNGMTGSLEEECAVSMLPPEAKGENYGSGIQVDARGRNLYVSNRGQDVISHFRIDGGDGIPVFSGGVPAGGRYPRHFILDPTGAFLLVANQRSDSIVVFRVDGDTGSLKPIGGETRVPAPACLAAQAPRQR